MSNELTIQTIEIIVKNFEIVHDRGVLQNAPTREELRNLLAERIRYLIDKDFERLLQILYRIDVDEEKAITALSQNPPAQAPFVLADLIIERQTEKMKTREQYRHGGNK